METSTIKSGEGYSGVELQLRGFEEVNVDDSCQTEVRGNRGGGSSGGAGGARYKLMSPAKLSISRSPCITIPPGLSPSSFLESPVLLSNIKVEPSPTTGSFTRSKLMHGSFTSATFPMTTASFASTVNERKSSFFEFKPRNASDKIPADVNNLINEHSVQIEGQSLAQSFAPSITVKSETASSSNDLNLSVPIQMNTSGSTALELESDELNPGGKSMEGLQLSGTDAKESGIPVVGERVSDDGYNWRKYGQKHVKGSEFPRSYYKCTHPNCEVKKLFERSHDGQITEIIYKGTHDHPKPQPNRRYTSGTTMSVQDERHDKASSLACLDDGMANGYGHISQTSEPNATPDQSPRVKNDDGPYGLVSATNKVHADDADDEDPFSKRRRVDIGSVDITPVVKPIREPRVVVQTLSEVDILDDGYRWRKYGQKVVRGNPNPRSYYKCTNAGCPVRKHVERASHDPEAVITTYEGKHDHDVPIAKSNSHDPVGPLTGSGMTRITSAENNAISLDLGVGINSAAASENRMNGKGQGQLLHSEYGENRTQPSHSNLKVVRTSHPVSAFFGGVNTNTSGSKGNLSEGYSMDGSSLNHSTYPYPQNMGRILTGP